MNFLVIVRLCNFKQFYEFMSIALIIVTYFNVLEPSTVIGPLKTLGMNNH